MEEQKPMRVRDHRAEIIFHRTLQQASPVVLGVNLDSYCQFWRHILTRSRRPSMMLSRQAERTITVVSGVITE